MQTDMHYSGTYAMARAAGFVQNIAQTIATAAEFVDDSDEVDVTTSDGFHIHAEPTAHHPTDMKENRDPEDQKRTWVPFHFIPGLQGSTVAEKLICVTDSPAAREVVAHTLDNLDKHFAIPLLGILAHSYADTFSHYGFSGISSPLNKVDPSSFVFHTSGVIKEKLGTSFQNFAAKYAIGPLANFAVQLGHGSVATYPDQPFLTWEFTYTSPQRTSALRENPKTFLIGCRKLHETFVEARKRMHGHYDDLQTYRDFAAIEAAVRMILATEGGAEERAAAWNNAMKAGAISAISEEIPEYDSSIFTSELSQLWAYDKNLALRTQVYLFLEAAEFHRDFILNELLPHNGVHIETAPIEWHS
jgi:uncharacterized protein DUF6765